MGLEEKKEKKTSTGEKGRTVLRGILFFIFILCAVYLISHLVTYAVQDYENNSVKNAHELSETEKPSISEDMTALLESMEAGAEAPGEEAAKKKEPISKEEALLCYLNQPFKKYDHAGLAAQNADYRMWIDIPGTKISYPVVQSKDNADYLTTSFEGVKRASGSIFIDANIKEYDNVKNLVLHGHNMKNGSMFGTLPSYHDVGFYNLHPFIYLYTEEETKVYQIVSYYVVPVTINEATVYRNSFSKEGDYQEFLDNILARSEIKINADISYEPQMLTLSTCVNNSTSRFVVHALRYLPEEND